MQIILNVILTVSFFLPSFRRYVLIKNQIVKNVVM